MERPKHTSHKTLCILNRPDIHEYCAAFDGYNVFTYRIEGQDKTATILLNGKEDLAEREGAITDAIQTLDPSFHWGFGSRPDGRNNRGASDDLVREIISTEMAQQGLHDFAWQYDAERDLLLIAHTKAALTGCHRYAAPVGRTRMRGLSELEQRIRQYVTNAVTWLRRGPSSQKAPEDVKTGLAHQEIWGWYRGAVG